MSRSKVALLGVAGVISAALLVTPLVSQTAGQAPPSFSTGYDPLLSEANCAESDSQLALTSRPSDDTIKLALANEEEIAFLQGIEPAGGGGSSTETGGDGPADGNLFNQILGELEDTQKGKKRYDVANLGGGPTGGFGSTGFAPMNTNGEPDPNNPLLPDPNNPGGGGCTVGCGQQPPPQETLCTSNCGEEDPIVKVKEPDGCTENCSEAGLIAVPEPASLGLLAFGIGLLAARRRRSA